MGSVKALIDHDLQLLSERGLSTVTLWVFEQNHAAQNLYASFGFVPDGARRVEPEYGAQEIRLAASPLPLVRPAQCEELLDRPALVRRPPPQLAGPLARG